MEIKSTLKNRRGQICPVIYHDIESLKELGGKKVDSVSAFCFCGDKMVVVFSEKKGYWTPPGGAVENVESDGDFTADPDGDITEIKLIEPGDYKKYFDWGEIGDHIIKQALLFSGELK